MTDEELMRFIAKEIPKCPEIVFAVKPKYLNPEDWEYAISLKPELFRRCKLKPMNLCMVALSLDGFNLEFIDPLEYSGDQYRRLCETAVMQNPKAYILVPKEFRTKEMRAYAYAKDPELMISEKKLTEGMVESILEHDPSLIQHIENPSDKLIIQALTKDPRVIVYFNTISPAVKSFFEETYPQYAAMLIHD